MEAATVRLVVSCPPNHPNNKRNRGGHSFSSRATAVDVTPDQAKQIEADPFLKVHRRLSRAWFLGHGIAFTEENIKKYETEEPELLAPVEAPGSTQTPGGNQTAGNGAGSQGAGTDDQGGGLKKLPVTTSKDNVIAALVLAKKVPNVDFNPEATRDSLLEYYNELAAQPTA